MDEDRISARFHRALDAEPPAGGFERLRDSLERRESEPRRHGRVWAPAVAAMLAVTLVATMLVARSVSLSRNAAPAAAPPLVVNPNGPRANVTFARTATAWWVLESAGNGSTLFRSTDQGRHWTAKLTTREEVSVVTQASTPASPDLVLMTIKLEGPNSTAVGHWSRTADGDHWTEFSKPQGHPNAGLIFLPDQRHLWATDARWLFRSTDGGATWTRLFLLDSLLQGINVLFEGQPVFFDANRGALQNPTGLWLTADGGQTWHGSRVPLENWEHVTGVLFQGDQGVATTSGACLVLSALDSQQPHIYRTTDGGAHWSLAGTTSGPFPNVELVSPTIWVIWYLKRRSFEMTTDGGRTVTTVTVPLPTTASPAPLETGPIPAVCAAGSWGPSPDWGISGSFTDADHGVVTEAQHPTTGLGPHIVLTTSDGGRSWAQVPLPNL